jgi:hypothetical protein
VAYKETRRLPISRTIAATIAFSTSGPFVGTAKVIELLSDGRYRLARLVGAPFQIESSIFTRRNFV